MAQFVAVYLKCDDRYLREDSIVDTYIDPGGPGGYRVMAQTSIGAFAVAGLSGYANLVDAEAAMGRLAAALGTVLDASGLH